MKLVFALMICIGLASCATKPQSKDTYLRQGQVFLECVDTAKVGTRDNVDIIEACGDISKDF